MDRETVICILLAIMIAVAVTIWIVTTGDWIRAEAAMFDGYSPEARLYIPDGSFAGPPGGDRAESGRITGSALPFAVPPLHPNGEGAGGEFP